MDILSHLPAILVVNLFVFAFAMPMIYRWQRRWAGAATLFSLAFSLSGDTRISTGLSLTDSRVSVTPGIASSIVLELLTTSIPCIFMRASCATERGFKGI